MSLRRFSLVAAVALAVAGCSSMPDSPVTAGSAAPAPTAEAAPAPAAPEPAVAPDASAAEQLDRLFEEFYEEYLEINPFQATLLGDPRYNDSFPNFIGPEHRRRSEELDRRYLERLLQIDRQLLTGQDLLSYEIFERDRRLSLEGYRYPDHLLPINQNFSMLTIMAQIGTGRGPQPFRTVEDYENWLGRVDGFIVWCEQAVANMREGIERGIVQPTVLIDGVLPQLSAHVVDDPEQSLFWGPVTSFPEDFSDADRERFTATFRRMIEQQIVPTYRRLHDFLRDEYLPACRDSVGLSALPGGEEWYRYKVKMATTTELTPQEIHRTGLAEVERLHGEIRGVMAQVGFEGSLEEFFEFLESDPRFYFEQPEQLLDGYEALRERVEEKLPALFDLIPQADYEIRAVEEFRARSASSAAYLPGSPDGARPGIFYVNTYDLKSRPIWRMESLSLHEAAPGHHFQLSLQMRLPELPRFRRFGGYQAYVEGWGLYAESLGLELGLYDDPYQYYGALSAELWRAIRLVVDTGLHALGWDRQQVLDYMDANAAVGETRANSETDRYIADPAQALSYKLGQLTITRLRRQAEEALGDDFDVRAFHRAVLEDGSLPLAVLEAKIERWIEERRTG